MTRGISWTSALLSSFLIGLCAPTSRGDDSRPDAEAAFEVTAQRAGAEYAVGSCDGLPYGRAVGPENFVF